MGSRKSGDRTRGTKRKPRPGSGRPPQFTLAVDRAVNAVNKLMDIAEARGVDMTELEQAQAALDAWAIKHADSEITGEMK